MHFFLFSVDHSETGKYNLVEHNEEYVMASNSSVPDQVKGYLPSPANERKNQPKENENHVSNVISDTPLSESAKEAFFQARNIAMDTYGTGILPARLENGVQPVKMVPDFTENPTLESVFVPPTVNSVDGTTRGPELYAPCTASNSGCFSYTSPLQLQQQHQQLQRQQQPQQQSQKQQQQQKQPNFSNANSNFPISAANSIHVAHDDHGISLSPASMCSPQTNYSPSSGYVSSPCQPPLSAEQSPSENLSLQQIDDLVDNIDLDILGSLTPTTSAPCDTRIPVTRIPNAAPQNSIMNSFSHPASSSHMYANTAETALPPIDHSLNGLLSGFTPAEQNLWPVNFTSNAHQSTQTAHKQPHHAKANGTNTNVLGSSLDQIIDDLLVETSSDVNSYPGVPMHDHLLANGNLN